MVQNRQSFIFVLSRSIFAVFNIGAYYGPGMMFSHLYLFWIKTHKNEFLCYSYMRHSGDFTAKNVPFTFQIEFFFWKMLSRTADFYTKS